MCKEIKLSHFSEHYVCHWHVRILLHVIYRSIIYVLDRAY